MSNEIVVTGASDWVGAHTSRVLHRLGWDVVGVSRNPRAAREWHPRWRWIGTGTELETAVERAGRVLHLADSTVLGQFGNGGVVHAERTGRAELTDRIVGALSRTCVGEPVLVRTCGRHGHGADGEHEVHDARSERDGTVPGGDRATREDTVRVPQVTRVASMRIGLVLGVDGGVFPVLRRQFENGHGVLLGSGRQWLPWIHLTDVVGLLVEALTDPAYVGVINTVAPRPARYLDLARAVADLLGVSWQARIPDDRVVRELGGASDLLLHGHRLVPETALARGFSFAHPGISDAVEDILVGPRPVRSRPQREH